MTLATYTPSAISEYAGNPWIEALPPRLGKEDFYKSLSCRREITRSDRSRSQAERIDLVRSLTTFFVPMPHHLELYEHIYSLMVLSYRNRNPLDRCEWSDIRKGSSEIAARTKMPPPRTRLSASLIGCSGVGKSTVLDRIRALFPSLLEHGSYNGVAVGRVQVPIIMVGAHQRSSLKDVCLQIFGEIDAIVGSNLSYTHGRQTIDGMLSAIARITAINAVALIVLDELQELAPTKSGGSGAVTSFLMHLSNTAKPALLTVATPQSRFIAQNQLHYIRRNSSIPEWRPFARTSPEWKVFINTLWKYQYTKDETGLSKTLSNQFHELSRGIPDLAIKIYEAVQEKLILYPSSRTGELITPEVVERVAYANFAREMEALRFLEQEFSPTEQRPVDLPSPEANEKGRRLGECTAAIEPEDSNTLSRPNTVGINSEKRPRRRNTASPQRLLASDREIEHLKSTDIRRDGLEFQESRM